MFYCFLYSHSFPGLKLIFLIIIGIAYLILKRSFKKDQEKVNSIIKQETERFKSESVKSTITFSEIEFFSNSWKKNIVIGSGVNAEEKLIDVHENTLLIRKTINGSIYDMKIEIAMEPTTLKMKIALKNEIDFYYNPNNPSEYHIDFSFLSEPS